MRFCEASAKDNFNVDEIFLKLVDDILKKVKKICMKVFHLKRTVCYFLVEDLLFRKGSTVVFLSLKEQVKLLTLPEASSLLWQQPFHPVALSILGINVWRPCLPQIQFGGVTRWHDSVPVYLTFAFLLFLFSHKD